jgi:hypothetical protein
MKKSICYLCGKPGADSKDHVPPKGLLPESQYGKYQRITIPAHRSCNSSSAGDEEYVRDLLIMEAEAHGLPKHELVTPKVWRAWTRPEGFKRYSSIIKTAVPVELVTVNGIYAGRAIGVKPDVERVKSIGRKITKGMIYHDAGVFLERSDMPIAILQRRDLPELKKRDSNNPFWIGLSSEHCLHDMCADTVAIRRFYEGVPCQTGTSIIASFAIVLWNCVLLTCIEFPIERINKKKFKFAINTVDIWQRCEES